MDFTWVWKWATRLNSIIGVPSCNYTCLWSNLTVAELSCRLRLQTFAACDIVCLVSGPGRWVLLTSFLWVRASDDPDSELKPFRVSIAFHRLPRSSLHSTPLPRGRVGLLFPPSYTSVSVFVFFVLSTSPQILSSSILLPIFSFSFLLWWFLSLSLMEFPVENCWFFSLKLHQPLILNYHQSRSLSELFLPRYVSLSLVSVLFVIFWCVR